MLSDEGIGDMGVEILVRDSNIPLVRDSSIPLLRDSNIPLVRESDRDASS